MFRLLFGARLFRKMTAYYDYEKDEIEYEDEEKWLFDVLSG
jgi:hypothetical protein